MLQKHTHSLIHSFAPLSLCKVDMRDCDDDVDDEDNNNNNDDDDDDEAGDNKYEELFLIFSSKFGFQSYF
jgi:hypothetical protein